MGYLPPLHLHQAPNPYLQAMDRCHRIGQTRSVLVLRLATAHSVEGKMLKRAACKMALERLVIKKGAFKGEVGGGPGGGAGRPVNPTLGSARQRCCSRLEGG